ncbi:hypothetical protein [Pseudobacteroides cellulosolvens]|uniref:Uncharacterized protein n=1 Tax=Pseudobacteroides cellulosolvens ATCC 35603 = DSM 2933 TaxID=398512 RepID=A0A0L6JI51_9FIRM|nr:hypothetical protein [Pseudobacteroides cellulosolvens]KNY25531.1 hypothetical protein Bccel_0791 [Pseudobacteroides cellulosolvens ATCC 35603 = DSM 2933]
MSYKYIITIILVFILLSGCSSKEPASDIHESGTNIAANEDTASAQPNNESDYSSSGDSVSNMTPSPSYSTSTVMAKTSDTQKTSSPPKSTDSQKTTRAPKDSAKPGAKLSQNSTSNQSQKPSVSGDPKANRQNADVMGEIESVSADTIKVKLIEMPQFNRNRDNLPILTPVPDGNGQIKEMPSGGNVGDRPKRQEQTVKYTGETKTLKLSSQVDISSMQRVNQEMAETKLLLKDLKAGDIISAWYSDNSTDTVSKISIRSKR